MDEGREESMKKGRGKRRKDERQIALSIDFLLKEAEK